MKVDERSQEKLALALPSSIARRSFNCKEKCKYDSREIIIFKQDAARARAESEVDKGRFGDNETTRRYRIRPGGVSHVHWPVNGFA